MKYECHGHIAMNGENFKAAMKRHENGVDKEFVRQNLKAVSEAGIGYFRDGGDKYMVSAYAKEIAAEYGIEYRSPIFAIHKKGYYGDIVGRAFSNMKEFAELVKEAKLLGADFIKIMVSGILNFKTDGRLEGPALTLGEIKEAVKIASSEGFAVMAHVNSPENIKNALEAGVKSVEHGFWPDETVIDYFLHSGAVWVPTASTVRNIIKSPGFPSDVLKNVLDAQGKVLKEAYNRGVLIACGSDSGAVNVPHGRCTLDEYEYLLSLGVNPLEANENIASVFKAK